MKPHFILQKFKGFMRSPSPIAPICLWLLLGAVAALEKTVRFLHHTSQSDAPQIP